MNRLAASAILAALTAGGCVSAHAASFAPARLVQTSTAPRPPASPLASPSDDPASTPGVPNLRILPPRAPETDSPDVRIADANAAARVEPSAPDYDQAAQVYSFAPYALFQVYAAPGRVTDIALQPGERLSDQGAIAAGDTARWIIGESTSGAGERLRTHVLLKPTRSDLATNLVIHTDRRTYHLELQARPDAYMAAVAWRYPHEEALAVERAAVTAEAREREPAVDLAALNFDYRIEGPAVAWRPVHVFDDGRQVFISFGSDIDQTRLPPLFVTSADGGVTLVNYRVEAGRMVVDRLFHRAELRLVEGRKDRVVRILRSGSRP